MKTKIKEYLKKKFPNLTQLLKSKWTRAEIFTAFILWFVLGVGIINLFS